MERLQHIIQKHTEAMHDEVAEYLRRQRRAAPDNREHARPGEFAVDMISSVSEGMMHPAEYKEWYTEEVGD